MDVVFRGCDRGGWWLVVLGCQGGSEVTRVGQKTNRKNTTQLKGGVGRVGERKERENVFWVELCF